MNTDSLTCADAEDMPDGIDDDEGILQEDDPGDEDLGDADEDDDD